MTSTPATGPTGTEGPAPTVTTADMVSAAVLAVPGVTRLHAGAFGEVATYLPGRRVTGVRIGEVTEVHVVVAAGAPVLPLAGLVRAAVEPLVATPVDVYVEDLDDEPATSSTAPAPSGPAPSNPVKGITP